MDFSLYFLEKDSAVMVWCIKVILYGLEYKPQLLLSVVFISVNLFKGNRSCLYALFFI